MRLWRQFKYVVIAPVIDLTIRLAPNYFSADKPPEWINYAGAGNYESIGDDIVRLLEEQARLKSSLKLVEVGCGIGRVAMALTRHYGDQIHYVGFDVVRFGITWCREKISKLHPRYQFHYADIYNDMYNPMGRLAASSFVFPVPNADCDLCFHSSVFTHMLADDVAHYLQETTRILKPGGVCLFSCFLYDQRHDAVMSKSQGSIDFSYRHGDAWVHNKTEPCVAVAYTRSDMKRMIASAGLCLENIIDGYWNDPYPKSARQHQDFILVRRET